MAESVRTLCWLVHKDLVRELRTHDAWPGMALLGLVVVFLLAAQLALPLDQKTQVTGGLLWMTIFVAGAFALERSFSNERDSGCWQSLRLYPIDCKVLFAAKLLVNCASLTILELVLIPAYVVLTDVPLLDHPMPLLLVAVLGTFCFASLGTLLSALTAGLRQRNGAFALLLLPLMTPVVLGAAEATRLAVVGESGLELWRWARLLGVFAVVFTVAGAVLFEFVMEE